MVTGTYYLGRLLKFGNLDQKMVTSSILNSPIVRIGRFDWTITDSFNGLDHDIPFVFGRLSKYAADGKVTVVDELSKSQVDADAHNLLTASSPFVYLPQFSGIAFLRVWNAINEIVFERRFRRLLLAANDHFFVDCHIDPVSDYRAFIARLSTIKSFTDISATVYPPNPLFGRLWEDLNDYVKRRNASSVTVKEASVKSDGIHTKIVELMQSILHNPNFQPVEKVDISDAAILMAADGYGRAKVEGWDGEKYVVHNTLDSRISFAYDSEPDPVEFAQYVHDIFSHISSQRDMGH